MTCTHVALGIVLVCTLLGIVHARMAFVVPFVERDVFALEQLIKYEWSRMPPFALSGNLRRVRGNAVDLVFYFYQTEARLGDGRQLLLSALAESQNKTPTTLSPKWFGGNVYFKFAALSAAEDRSYMRGANELFLRIVCPRGDGEMFLWMSNMYSAFFLFESDVHVIREGWAARAAQIVQGPERFWVNGAIYTGPETLAPAYAAHINGNAFYTLNSGLQDVVCPFFRRHPETVDVNGYDVTMYQYMYSHRLGNESAKITHRFRYTPYIVNVAHSWITLADALGRYPNSFLVHSKNFGH